MPPVFKIGRERTETAAAPPFELPAHHLVTHGVILGMTGSGKTGLTMVVIEEALHARVPTLVIDLKGDLPNLLFSFPQLATADVAPWIDADAATRAGRSVEDLANETLDRLKKGLAEWGLQPSDLQRMKDSFAPRIITPGAKVGEPIDVLSSLSRRSRLWDEDEELAREQLGAGVSLLLRLAGRDGDARSREHVVLSALAERRIKAGEAAPLDALLRDVMSPPLSMIGAMPFDDFLPAKERQSLAQDLNALVASPKLATWLSGAPLDIAEWLKPRTDKAPLVIVSVSHLDDDERQLVLGLLFEELLGWVRGLSGTSDLRALVVFDEVYGYLPPHPANPPTKKPLLTLMKQARAFGVGVVVCTQNPMDLDYKALSNAGAWFVGRLQTDADRERVVEGLSGSDGGLGGLEPAALANVLRNLAPRTFFVRDVHRKPPCTLIETRQSMSWMRGPLTRRELARLASAIAPVAPPAPGPAPAAAPAPAIAVSPAPAPAPQPSSAPEPPPEWRSYFIHPPAGAAAARLTPHVAATFVVRGRDPSLKVSVERHHCVLAPLDTTGKPDLARASVIDPRHLSATAPPAGTYAELPSALSTKRAAQAVEKTLKELVASRFPIDVLVHRDFELHAAPNESREVFLQRCRAEAERLATAEQHALVAKFAPKIAKAEQKIVSAQREHASAEQAANAAPGDLGAAFLRMALGKQASAPMVKKRAKAEESMERAQRAYAQHYAALEALRAEQQAAIAAEFDRLRRSAEAVEVARLLPKRGDVDVLGIGVAWVPEAKP